MVPPNKAVTTVPTKGQIILPKAIRDQRHWDAGTRLVIEDTEAGALLTHPPGHGL